MNKEQDLQEHLEMIKIEASILKPELYLRGITVDNHPEEPIQAMICIKARDFFPELIYQSPMGLALMKMKLKACKGFSQYSLFGNLPEIKTYRNIIENMNYVTFTFYEIHIYI